MQLPALLTRVAFAAASLLVPLASQSISFAPGELTRIRLSAAVPSDGLSQAVTGHFTGMHVRDAIVLAGGTPVLVTAPGVLRSAVTLPNRTGTVPGFDRSRVRAIATVPNFAGQGLDALAVVTDINPTPNPHQPEPVAGLWLWYKVPDYATGSAQYRMTLLSSLPIWAGVTKLRVAELGSAGQRKVGIFGLQNNSQTIRCIEMGDLQDPSQWVQWRVATEGRVHDFQIADVIPGGSPEIVVLSGAATGSYPFNGGLRLFAPVHQPTNALPLQTVLAPNSGGVLAAVTDGSGTRVFAAARFGGVDTLVVFVGDPAGLGEVEGGSCLLGGEPTAMAVGPWRHAPDLDVVVTLKGQANPVVSHCFLQQRWRFTAPAVVPITSGLPPVGYENLATPLIADFHGDPAAPLGLGLQGRPHLLYPVESLPGEPGSIAIENELQWLSGDVKFGPGYKQVSGVPAAGVQPTRVSMLSWEFDAEPMSPTAGKARTGLLRAAESELELNGATHEAAMTTFECPTGAWIFMARFECEVAGQTIRWPARGALATRSEDGRLMLNVRNALAAIYGPLGQIGTGLVDYWAELEFAGGCVWGIVGDVIQPPGTGDSDDDDDAPPGGAGG